MSQVDPIRELRDLVQQRINESAADKENGLSPKSRQILSELFGKVVDHLRDLHAAVDNLTWRVEHTQEGPHGTRYPKA